MSRIVPEVDGVPIHVWLATPLGADVRTALERLAKAPDVNHLAVMPDVPAGSWTRPRPRTATFAR